MEPFVFDGVYQPVLVGDTAAPASGKVSFQRFRFTDAFKWRSEGVFYKFIDPL
jgi:hypothetical protein